jgi:predicted RNase H-like HicB family nuclease
MPTHYAVVIEKVQCNHSAYVPDLLGCVATRATVAQVERSVRDAIAFQFHLDGFREGGAEIPQPSSQVEYVEIAG